MAIALQRSVAANNIISHHPTAPANAPSRTVTLDELDREWVCKHRHYTAFDFAPISPKGEIELGAKGRREVYEKYQHILGEIIEELTPELIAATRAHRTPARYRRELEKGTPNGVDRTYHWLAPNPDGSKVVIDEEETKTIAEGIESFSDTGLQISEARLRALPPRMRSSYYDENGAELVIALFYPQDVARAEIYCDTETGKPYTAGQLVKIAAHDVLKNCFPAAISVISNYQELQRAKNANR